MCRARKIIASSIQVTSSGNVPFNVAVYVDTNVALYFFISDFGSRRTPERRLKAGRECFLPFVIIRYGCSHIQRKVSAVVDEEYVYASLNDGDTFGEMRRLAISSLCERHRVYLHNPSLICCTTRLYGIAYCS
jgi:hypothetical protein